MTDETPRTERLARTIMRSDWFRQQKRTLRTTEFPTLAQVVALIEAAAAPPEPPRPDLRYAEGFGRMAWNAGYRAGVAAPQGQPLDVLREIRGRLFEAAWRTDDREWLDPRVVSDILDDVELRLSESGSPGDDR